MTTTNLVIVYFLQMTVFNNNTVFNNGISNRAEIFQYMMEINVKQLKMC